MNTERMMVKVAQIDTIKINEYIYASNGKLVEINRYRRSFRDGGVSLKEKNQTLVFSYRRKNSNI